MAITTLGFHVQNQNQNRIFKERALNKKYHVYSIPYLNGHVQWMKARRFTGNSWKRCCPEGGIKEAGFR